MRRETRSRVVGPDPMTVRDIANKVRTVMRADKDVIDPHFDWNERAPVLRLRNGFSSL